MRYIDPLTGQPVEKNAETGNHGKAVKAACAWKSELREGRYQKPGRMTWEAFREYYWAMRSPGARRRTADTYESSLNVFEEKCKPAKLASVTTARVTEFVTLLWTDLGAEATIAHHCATESGDAMGSQARLARDRADNSPCRSG